MYVDECIYERGDKTYYRTLMRESYRQAGKEKHQTIGNISKASPHQIKAVKAAQIDELTEAGFNYTPPSPSHRFSFLLL